MNVRTLRTFSYWGLAMCLLLFMGDLSTQQFSLSRENAKATSFSACVNHLVHTVSDSGTFVVHSLFAGVTGGHEAAAELIPYLIETTADIAEATRDAIVHPIDTFHLYYEKVTLLATNIIHYLASLNWETVQRYYQTIRGQYVHYCALPAAERGAMIGHLIGYHVMDFYGGTIAIKTLFHIKHYSCVNQLIQKRGLPALLQMGPTERVKGFALAVNQATRRERYMYQLKHSLSEPYNTRSYGPSECDGMRLLLDCSPLRAVGTVLTGGTVLDAVAS